MITLRNRKAMQPTEQELGKSYQGLPDDEIASLYAQFDTLTEIARHALALEIQRRELSDAALRKMHAAVLRREAAFDRRDKVRRADLAAWILFRGDPKGTVVALLLIVVLLLIFGFMARHR